MGVAGGVVARSPLDLVGCLGCLVAVVLGFRASEFQVSTRLVDPAHAAGLGKSAHPRRPSFKKRQPQHPKNTSSLASESFLGCVSHISTFLCIPFFVWRLEARRRVARISLTVNTSLHLSRHSCSFQFPRSGQGRHGRRYMNTAPSYCFFTRFPTPILIWKLCLPLDPHRNRLSSSIVKRRDPPLPFPIRLPPTALCGLPQCLSPS